MNLVQAIDTLVGKRANAAGLCYRAPTNLTSRFPVKGGQISKMAMLPELNGASAASLIEQWVASLVKKGNYNNIFSKKLP